MNPSRQTRRAGFTIIEILACVGMIAVASLVLAGFLTHQRGIVKNSAELDQLKAIITRNLSEVHTRTPSSITARCVRRHYDDTGQLVDEAEFQTSDLSNPCASPLADSQHLTIYWIITWNSAPGAEFTPSEFLKVPRYSQALQQVRVLGFPKLHGSGVKPLGVTVFRR